MRAVSGCIILIFALGFTKANAEEFAVRGYGGTSCAQFGAVYKANLAVEDAYYSWALGFMSGINFAQKPGDLRAMRKLSGDPDEEKALLRRYCAVNPLKNYMDAVVALYLSFPHF
jgi:hypothetical protein